MSYMDDVSQNVRTTIPRTLCADCFDTNSFRLPEPKHRTYGELDILFENRVSAWNFKRTSVDIFRGSSLAVAEEKSPSEQTSSEMDVEERIQRDRKSVDFRDVDFGQHFVAI